MSAAFLAFSLFIFIQRIKITCSWTVHNGVIVGSGRIGQFMYESNNKLDTLISRNSGVNINEDASGPIYICTRNDDLENVIQNTPKKRLTDLVFLQNGMLEPLLLKHGLQDNTQGLIYFAVAKKGELPTDGVTDLNPEGLTSVTGKWADDFSHRMHKANLACHALDRNAWEVAMYEKLIWISAFMVVGAKYPGATVGDVEKQHTEEVEQIITELARSVEQTKRITFPPRLSDRLRAYARSVAHFPTALKEFNWRNGWFLDVSRAALARGENDPSPQHTALLRLLKSELFAS